MPRGTLVRKNSPSNSNLAKKKILDQPLKRVSFWSTFGLGEERDYFVENLSLLLASGIDVITALSAIARGVKSIRLKKIIADTQDLITSGYSLAAALERTNLLPTHIIALVRVGEKTGRLAQNLGVISNQYKKDRIFRSKIRSAMLYPVFVLSLAFVIGMGIAWFILPKLAHIFETLTIPLPFITKVLIKTGNFLGEHGQIFVPSVFLGIGLLVFIIFFFSRTKFIGQSILFHMPGIRDLIRELELARSGYILGTLLESGLPITDALDSVRDTATFLRFKKFYSYLTESIIEGNSFEKSFKNFPTSTALFPIPIQQMIFSAEQSGKLAGTFISIGQTFEGKTETSTKNLATVLEPMLLVLVWIAVMIVALAVVLPIYSLIGNLNH